MILWVPRHFFVVVVPLGRAGSNLAPKLFGEVAIALGALRGFSKIPRPPCILPLHPNPVSPPRPRSFSGKQPQPGWGPLVLPVLQVGARPQVG